LWKNQTIFEYSILKIMWQNFIDGKYSLKILFKIFTYYVFKFVITRGKYHLIKRNINSFKKITMLYFQCAPAVGIYAHKNLLSDLKYKCLIIHSISFIIFYGCKTYLRGIDSFLKNLLPHFITFMAYTLARENFGKFWTNMITTHSKTWDRSII